MKQHELIFGVNPVREALRGNRTSHVLYVQVSASDHRVEKIIKLAGERGVAVHRRDREALSRMCGSTHHQGIVLEVEPFRYADFDDMIATLSASNVPGFLLVLDGIQDPHNLGALIRSAACAGVNGVVIPRERACGITASVEKTSAGAVEFIPVAQVVNIAQTLEALKKVGFWIYGLASEVSHSLFDEKFTGNCVLVVGNEGEGLRPLVRRQCDVVMSIPQFGGVSSLNASVAGGIALFEMARDLRG